MSNERYRYDVYDNTVDSTIHIDLTREELIQAINIPSDKISEYAKQGYAFARRYVIMPRLIDANTPVIKTKQLSARDKMIKREWERMRDAVDVIKDGGHIVTKHKGIGYIKYVEAKR